MGFTLTARHGCKCLPGVSITVEDCLAAISSEIGAPNILSASRMNKAVIVFVKEESMVHHLVEVGLSVGDVFLLVLPLTSPSKRVTLSNVPPFISNDSLERMLSRYGKIMMPIKMIPLGVKNPDLKHVMSFRRQTALILNAEFQYLDVSVKLTLAGKDYTIFISTESMKCFSCGVYGHTKLNCTNEKVTEQSETEPKTPLEQVNPAMENDNQDGRDKTDQRAESDSLSKDDANPKEDAVISHAENMGECSLNANVRSAASGGSEIIAAGNSESERPMEPDELVGVADSESRDLQVGL